VDETYDSNHALSTRQCQRVVEADTPRFWNLTWLVIGDPVGCTYSIFLQINQIRYATEFCAPHGDASPFVGLLRVEPAG